MSPADSAATISGKTPSRRWRASHSTRPPSRYFSVTISRMGPTLADIPPCTTTSDRSRPRRASSLTRSRPSSVCRGSRRPRLEPHSTSVGSAAAPSISLIPGQMPPLSCQPPPEPANHSPRSARPATMRRSASSSGPSSERACPVARMHTAIRLARRFVDTARRLPLGMSLT